MAFAGSSSFIKRSQPRIWRALRWNRESPPWIILCSEEGMPNSLCQCAHHIPSGSHALLCKFCPSTWMMIAGASTLFGCYSTETQAWKERGQSSCVKGFMFTVLVLNGRGYDLCHDDSLHCCHRFAASPQAQILHILLDHRTNESEMRTRLREPVQHRCWN